MLQRGTNLSPNASWLWIAALAYFSPRPRLPIWPRTLLSASGSVGTAAWLVLSSTSLAWLGLKPTPNVFSFAEKADLA